MQRGITAEIDLSSFAHNLSVVRSLYGSRRLIAVVKADAYGHGSVEVGKRAADEGADYLAVAFTGEAVPLREAGITTPIIALFDPDVTDVFTYDLIPVIAGRKAALSLSKEAVRRNRRISVHVKLDTGMGRTGIREDYEKEILFIADCEGLDLTGVLSHFSEADLADKSFAVRQIDLFRNVGEKLAKRGKRGCLFHIANSAAVFGIPEAHFDAVRPGLALYGYMPEEQFRKSENDPKASELKPVMTVKARIIAIRRVAKGTPISYGRTFTTKRESLIAVISAGYADGFDRRFSNNADVLIRGKRCPVVGRVCMDLIMADVTGVIGAEENDEVILIGKDGSEMIDAWELASRAGTIPYEILISLGSRARRVYLQ